MQKRYFLPLVLLLAVVLFAAPAPAGAQALFKYAVSADGIAVGTVVYANAHNVVFPATPANRDQIVGVVVSTENFGPGIDSALVATSGIIEVVLTNDAAPGSRLTVDGSGNIDLRASDEDVLIGIAIGDGDGVNPVKIQLMINNNRAKFSEYTASGSLTGIVSNVQDALDSLTARTDVLGTDAFLEGGNSFGEDADLGTNDAYDLNIRTNGTTRMTVEDGGQIVMQANTDPVRIENATTANGGLDVFASGAANTAIDGNLTRGLGAGEAFTAVQGEWVATTGILGGDFAMGNLGSALEIAGVYQIAGVSGGISNAGTPLSIGALGYQRHDGVTALNAGVYGSNAGIPNTWAGYFEGDVNVSDRLITQDFRMTDGAGLNYLMVSDASGNGTWTSASAFNGFILNQAPDGIYGTGQTANFDIVGNGEIGGTLNVNGPITLGTVNAGAATDSLITRDGVTGELRAASASTMLGGDFFMNGGNTFATPGDAYLGTNDNRTLFIETNNTPRMRIADNGTITAWSDNNPFRIRQNAGATTDGLLDIVGPDNDLIYGVAVDFSPRLTAGSQRTAITGFYNPGAANIVGATALYGNLGSGRRTGATRELAAVSGILFNGATPLFSGALGYQVNDGSSVLLNAGVAATAPLIANNYAAIFDGAVRLGATGSYYTMPTADGTVNQIMATDGAGIVTWQDPSTALGQATAMDNYTPLAGTDTVLINATAWFTLATINYTPHNNGVMLSFSGTFDDRNGNTGAYIELILTADGGTTALARRHIVLQDMNFHQSQVASIDYRISPAGTLPATYQIMARVVKTPYTSGRCVDRTFTLLEIND